MSDYWFKIKNKLKPNYTLFKSWEKNLTINKKQNVLKIIIIYYTWYNLSVLLS